MAIIAIDFDHTLVNGDKPIEGAKDAINLLREKGHTILIHSCNGTKWVGQVMNNCDMRYDYIWEGKGKPVAHLYVDDRGVHFNGDWKSTLETILARLE